MAQNRRSEPRHGCRSERPHQDALGPLLVEQIGTEHFFGALRFDLPGGNGPVGVRMELPMQPPRCILPITNWLTAPLTQLILILKERSPTIESFVYWFTLQEKAALRSLRLLTTPP